MLFRIDQKWLIKAKINYTMEMLKYFYRVLGREAQ